MAPSAASLRVPENAPILVVDDDAALREALQLALQLGGQETATVADGGEAIAWLQATRPSLVLLDLSLPVLVGEEVAAVLRSRYGDAIRIVVMSAGADAPARAHRLGAWEVLRKPFDIADLLDVVRHALADTARSEGR